MACSQTHKADDSKKPIAAFLVFNKNEETRNSSTSGGVFSAVGEYVIANDGVVYGAAFDPKYHLYHERAVFMDDLTRLRGTKYLQSNAFQSFVSIQQDLNQGKKVLFVGTPCQVYALKVFLAHDYQNLYTVDLICHGVPSPALFRGYIHFLQKKCDGEIINFQFRSKEHANSRISYTSKYKVRKEDGSEETVFIDGDEDPYIMQFLSNRLQCKACFQCNFTSLDRQGDLTLGDYWGYSEAHPEFGDIQGVSLVLENTVKGNELLFACRDKLHMVLTKEEKYLHKNRHLQSPPTMSDDRNRIYEAFVEKGFNQDFYRHYFLPKGYYQFLVKRRIIRFLNANKE